MPYVLNTADEQAEMLRAIGIQSIDELFDCIPSELQLQRPLEIPAAMGELELTSHMQALSDQNQNIQQQTCFLGGGSYDHFVPAVVDALASRGEFFTSYTPYQPEVSQGNLQVMFEYQTLICQLTGMDVSNASLYDGGSAATEAILMAMSITRRTKKIVVANSVHPEYRQILETYFACIGADLVVVDCPQGIASVAAIEETLDDETAAVLIQSPNFLEK